MGDRWAGRPARDRWPDVGRGTVAQGVGRGVWGVARWGKVTCGRGGSRPQETEEVSPITAVSARALASLATARITAGR
ncbi:hypothetical protein GCM10010524_57050 [Streptomyces mexicanus]